MVDRIAINLLPAEYRVHAKTIRIPRGVFYSILGVALLGVGLWFATLVVDAKIGALTQESADLDNKIKQNRHIEQEINELKRDRREVIEKIQALERINVNRARWVRIMEALCQDLPDFTWLVSIEERDSVAPVLAIEGRTFSFPEVANYMTKLKSSPYILGVDLADIEQINQSNKLYRFNIAVVTNPNVGIAADDDSLSTVNGPPPDQKGRP